MDEDEFDWAPGSTWFVEDDEDDERVIALIRCAEMVLKSIEARRKAERGDRRVRPPAQYYDSEFYYLTAARFFALASVPPSL